MLFKRLVLSPLRLLFALRGIVVGFGITALEHADSALQRGNASHVACTVFPRTRLHASLRKYSVGALAHIGYDITTMPSCRLEQTLLGKSSWWFDRVEQQSLYISEVRFAQRM